MPQGIKEKFTGWLDTNNETARTSNSVVPTNFEYALSQLKSGHKVARSGWNGKGMWIVLVQPPNYPVDENSSGYKAAINYDPTNSDSTPESIGMPDTLPFIAMKTADNHLVPWLASQTDILAHDWEVVE